MIIEYTQKKEALDISYVDKNNQIAVKELFLKDGYYNYEECDETDPLIIPGLKSFYGSFIKKVPDKYFKYHNINEFFSQDLPTNYPEEHKLFSKLIQPNPFACDIEVMPTDKYGYSDQIKVENPITSISLTDHKLNTLLFIVKNDKHPEFNDLDKSYINGILRETLKQHANKYAYGFEIRVFDTEIEMLEVFVECVNKYFHLIMGHNFLQYDWSYIFNRCGKIGVDLKKASPTRRLSKKRIDINKNTSIEIKTPTHRIITDQMLAFKESLIYNNLGSYSLDNISHLILKLNKVSFQGNLRTLYENDFLRFIAYSLIDTILVMLIHKATDLITVDFFQSYYTNVPFLKLSQNSISEALIYQELKASNQFLLASERNTKEKRKYAGGYVKNPTKKIVNAVIGEDYGALYPNTMITNGISIEAYIDSISIDESLMPKTIADSNKWEMYKKMGYTLLPTGRIYDTTSDYLYTRIEKKLLTQRGIFKGHMTETFLEIIPKIEEKIKQLENKTK